MEKKVMSKEEFEDLYLIKIEGCPKENGTCYCRDYGTCADHWKEFLEQYIKVEGE